jgi:hypothetical protein
VTVLALLLVRSELEPQRESEGATVKAMTFDEVVRYLQGAIGHRIDVHAWPNRADGIGVHVSGVVTRIVELPVPGSEPRYYCQIGKEEGNGFRLSPAAFRKADVDLVDPDTLGLFIGLEGDFQLVIEDERIEWKDGRVAPLPT